MVIIHIIWIINIFYRCIYLHVQIYTVYKLYGLYIRYIWFFVRKFFPSPEDCCLVPSSRQKIRLMVRIVINWFILYEFTNEFQAWKKLEFCCVSANLLLLSAPLFSCHPSQPKRGICSVSGSCRRCQCSEIWDRWICWAFPLGDSATSPGDGCRQLPGPCGGTLS